MFRTLISVALAVFFTVGTAWADGDMVKGEVVKIDKSAGKITLKHGPIKKLDMDSMTMVFRVADPAMLDKVKAGDRVTFEADRVNGAITVTTLDKIK
ncbi:MAG: copper-binding protein [Reyranella sp.]|nr:copper-binding protein [Reyranella sp.]